MGCMLNHYVSEEKLMKWVVLGCMFCLDDLKILSLLKSVKVEKMFLVRVVGLERSHDLEQCYLMDVMGKRLC